MVPRVAKSQTLSGRAARGRERAGRAEKEKETLRQQRSDAVGAHGDECACGGDVVTPD
jgi:hypothetical protein